MSEKVKKERTVRLPNFFEALLPIVVMLGLMLYHFVAGTGYGDAHMPLLISIVVACIVGCVCGHTFSEMMAGMLDCLNRTMEAILILCTVGILVASFIMSGTIPALIYYGLDLLTPKLFLPIGCILCAIVGLACGSSWTTTATMGIAMLGIGAGLGMPVALTAGMVISGAYVGDKFSPLSDTTNLAAAVSETGLFDHVSAMVSTTAPTFIIALVLYTILGLNYSTAGFDNTVALELQAALADGFNLNPILLLPIVVIVVVCVIKLPALPGLAISVGCGVLFGAIFQGITNISDIFDILHYGTTFESSNALANDLLSRGGMDHQMWTINLVLLAVAYGGALECCGCV
ncbi:MAG: Na+/H+ antiporter NhaC family protein, partial [Clostridium sp.]